MGCFNSLIIFILQYITFQSCILLEPAVIPKEDFLIDIFSRFLGRLCITSFGAFYYFYRRKKDNLVINNKTEYNICMINLGLLLLVTLDINYILSKVQDTEQDTLNKNLVHFFASFIIFTGYKKFPSVYMFEDENQKGYIIMYAIQLIYNFVYITTIMVIAFNNGYTLSSTNIITCVSQSFRFIFIILFINRTFGWLYKMIIYIIVIIFLMLIINSEQQGEINLWFFGAGVLQEFGEFLGAFYNDHREILRNSNITDLNTRLTSQPLTFEEKEKIEGNDNIKRIYLTLLAYSLASLGVFIVSRSSYFLIIIYQILFILLVFPIYYYLTYPRLPVDLSIRIMDDMM